MRILGVLHPGGGRAGLLAERARAAGDELLEWVPARGEPAPLPPAEADAVVVFGGGMNLRDAARMPWITGEVELLRDALEGGRPTLGICLGGQLLAAAGGAEVQRASRPEIGFFEVTRTGREDPVLGALPERFEAYQWHSYAFALPAGSVELARSAVCPQAFRLRERAWGVQFHPEVTPPIVRGWAEDYESDPDAVAMGFDVADHLAWADQALPAWMELGRRLFDAFLATARAAAGRPAPAARSAQAPPPRRG